MSTTKTYTAIDLAQHFTDANFIVAFNEMQEAAAAINQKNGFVAEDALCDQLEKFLATSVDAAHYMQFKPLFPAFRNARAGLKIALIMSELGETLEAVRKNLGPDDHIPGFTAEEAEAADAIIRLMNYAQNRRLRLAEAVVAKNEFNRNRADHSKEGRATEHGKQF